MKAKLVKESLNEERYEDVYFEMFKTMPKKEFVEIYNTIYDRYTNSYKAGNLYGQEEERDAADHARKVLDVYEQWMIENEDKFPDVWKIITKAQIKSENILNN